MAFYHLHTAGNILCCDLADLEPRAMRHAIESLTPRVIAAGHVLPHAGVTYTDCDAFLYVHDRIMFDLDGNPHDYRDNADWSEVQYYAPREVQGLDHDELCTFNDLPDIEAIRCAIVWMLEEFMLPEECDNMGADEIAADYYEEAWEAANLHDLMFTHNGVLAFHRTECEEVEWPVFPD